MWRPGGRWDMVAAHRRHEAPIKAPKGADYLTRENIMRHWLIFGILLVAALSITTTACR